MARPRLTESALDKSFWARVAKRGKGQCWPWLGWKQENGYGKYSRRGKFFLAHRFAYHLAVGPIPESLLVCHHCDNRICCNPSHLFVGTHKDNTQDSITKGRFVNPGARLTLEQVSEIKQRYTPRKNVGKLASEFGIDPKHVWAIAHGRCWR